MVSDIVAVEFSRVDDTYAWDLGPDDQNYSLVTLFPDVDISKIPRSKVIERICTVLTKIDPAVVAVPGWSNPIALAALLWCRRNQIPVVMMSDSTAHDQPRKWWREILKKHAIQNASAALVAGSAQQEYIVQLGMYAENTFRGYDVVDNVHFLSGAESAKKDDPEVRARFSLPENYFLVPIRFIEEKNIPFLLQAYEGYRKKAGNNAWHLVLLGDGPLRQVIEAFMHEKYLDEWVLLPGFKQYNELPIYYGLAGAVMLASTSETWGLVVNEAMAAGLPVLVSNRCGCAPDLVRNGENGYTFDPTDATTLMDLMIFIASGACDRESMGRRSREIIADWTLDTFVQGLIAAADAALGADLPKFRWWDHALLWALMRR